MEVTFNAMNIVTPVELSIQMISLFINAPLLDVLERDVILRMAKATIL